MLSLSNISFEFGGRYLYKEATWQINPGEKYGLVGLNGTGKSTLLRIINGEYRIESGEISKLKNLSLGFLNQDLLSYNSGETILEVALQAFSEVLQLERDIHSLLELIEHDHSEKNLHDLHDKQVLFEASDGYNLKPKAGSLLEGLGFTTADLSRPLHEFSGGWRMRVMLAKMILQQPDILMLDEPTNHLDLPSIQWIEGYLRDYKGTLIIVSHDRYFLDNVVNKIAEIANRKITVYNGNYSSYLDEKLQRETLQKAQFKNQQQYIREQEKLIDRFRAKASKARMVQSRIKMMERLDRIDDVEGGTPEIRIRFDMDRQPGKVIADLDIQEKSYGEQVILKNTSAKISRGDKIALIGANGKGKSTLLRMIYGSEPYLGKAAPVHNVVPAFYAQHQLEALNLENDLIMELTQFAPDRKDVELRSVLGAFLFTGEDVFKKIKVLSGGEKSRVALAKTMLSKANFLILDEPTNHLDMQSVGILVKVLEEFEGSFIIVSHDRYFLSLVANKIWWIEDHEVKEYPGLYEEYEYSREKIAEENERRKKMKVDAAKKTVNSKIASRSNEDDRKIKERMKLNHRFQAIEADMERLQTQKNTLEAHLSQPEIYENQAEFKEFLQKLNDTEARLKELTQEWEKLFEALTESD